MSQTEKAERFATLHVKGKPLVLYNAWDAGSAKAIVAAGAEAIATSSYSVAEAQGYRDGEQIPQSFLAQIAARIASAVNVPVSIDFEGGYSEDEEELASNISRLLDLGVVGINFEDRIVNGTGLYSIDQQARRIGAIRQAAKAKGIALFINARTDEFFNEPKDPKRVIGAVLDRAKTYAAAGASGLFIPGLQQDALIGKICEDVTLPVNVMVMAGMPTNELLAKLGVARISYGPIPHIEAMAALKEAAKKVLS
jgi:2-methylisocitrate lyase-like PEP mutase family enzyme